MLCRAVTRAFLLENGALYGVCMAIFTIVKGYQAPQIYLFYSIKKEVLPQMLRPIPQKLRICHAILLH